MDDFRPFTAIVRKGVHEYVAVALEYNVAARGEDLSKVEENLAEVVEASLEDASTEDVVIEPIPIDELIEFLRETASVSPSAEIPNNVDISRVQTRVVCYG